MNLNHKKIIIFQRILPNYRVQIFKKIIKRFRDTCIMYGQPQKGEVLRSVIIKDYKHFQQVRNFYLTKSKSIFISNIFFKILVSKPKIIITVYNIGNINLYLFFILRAILKFRIILWSFGYDPKRGFNPNLYLKDKIR